MLVLALVALYIVVAAAKQEEWGVIKTKTISKRDGTIIKTKFGKFVEVTYGIAKISPSFIKLQTNVTKANCAAQCLNSVERCLLYHIHFDDLSLTKGECVLFSNLGKAEENKYAYFYFNPFFTRNLQKKYYEIKVSHSLVPRS